MHGEPGEWTEGMLVRVSSVTTYFIIPEGNLSYADGNDSIHEIAFEVDPKTIGEFVCSIDGKNIFEGDLILTSFSMYQVVYYRCGFYLVHHDSALKGEKWGPISRMFDSDTKDIFKDMEIVGTIHDQTEKERRGEG